MNHEGLRWFILKRRQGIYRIIPKIVRSALLQLMLKIHFMIQETILVVQL